MAVLEVRGEGERRGRMQNRDLAHRKPEVGLSLREIDVVLLTNAVSRIYDANDTLFPAYFDHALPWHKKAWAAKNTIEHTDRLRMWISFGGYRPRKRP